MTETAASPADEEPAAAPPPDLPALTAGKLCHDFIGQVGAIISGLDLLEDDSAADMRQDALAMIAASARKLAVLMEFDRVAYGASGGAEAFGVAELERLARGVFSHMRADLDWRIEVEQLAKPCAKTLLHLSQIAGAALIAGGTVKARGAVREGRFLLRLEASGPRCRIKPEVLAGLRGEAVGEGLPGQWIQAALVQRQIAAAGGRMAVEADEAQLRLACDMAA